MYPPGDAHFFRNDFPETSPVASGGVWATLVCFWVYANLHGLLCGLGGVLPGRLTHTHIRRVCEVGEQKIVLS